MYGRTNLTVLNWTTVNGMSLKMPLEGAIKKLQLYTDRLKNIRVENDKLIIEAHRDIPNIQGTQRQFSSGKIRTKHRGDWSYGKIEIRAKTANWQRHLACNLDAPDS